MKNPETESVRACVWSNLYDVLDDPTVPHEVCVEPATHTTCDPIGGVVCARHRCRCSKPLAAESTRLGAKP